jgi:hypothetical protein
MHIGILQYKAALAHRSVQACESGASEDKSLGKSCPVKEQRLYHMASNGYRRPRNDTTGLVHLYIAEWRNETVGRTRWVTKSVTGMQGTRNKDVTSVRMFNA